MSDSHPIVLCVDDDTFTLSSLKEALKESYRVLLAMDPDTGVELALKHEPNLIIMDINMPGMSGIDVAQMLSNVPQTSHIPIVFLSAFDTPLEKKRATELGAKAFLGKPCSLVEVRKTVDQVLSGR